MIAPRPEELARTCLPALGEAQVERLGGGANNRLYRVRGAGQELVLKHYFRHPERPRDRLAAEYGFLEYAWGLGLRCIPEPVARDDAQGVALYRLVPGRPFEPGEIGLPQVREALAFVAALNRPDRRGAAGLPPASEACFSVEAHLALVEARLDRLGALPPGDEVDVAAARFVAERLRPALATVAARIRRRLGAAPPTWARELPAGDRLVSPSDFGFHNALRLPGGGAAFLDFEHAGWDDPAKLLCDLFLQPALPLPRGALAEATDRLAGLVADGPGLRERALLLWPLLSLKWCCILLNPFVPVDRARRAFAAGDPAPHRPGQLAAAERLLSEVSPATGA